MSRSPEPVDLLERLARERGLDLGTALRAALPGIESLRRRLRDLADLPLDAAPPPDGPLER